MHLFGKTAESLQSHRHVTWVDIDVIKRPTPSTLITIGYTNGYDVWECLSGPFASLVKPDMFVDVLRILPSSEGPVRNMALVERNAPTVVNCIDLTTNESYHVIRMTERIERIEANRFTIAIGTGDQVHLLNSESLQETHVLHTLRPVWSLSDRWIAYNMISQESETEPHSSVFGKLWSKLSVLGQDAFDNVVLAVRAQTTIEDELSQHPTMSSLQSPTRVDRDARNGVIAIQDTVSLKVISTVEENFCGSCRPIETIQWSTCGSLLMVSSGNGHNVLVYGIDCGPGPHVGFSVKKTLNRGITPAVITSMTSNQTQSAICSAKGTAHVFDATGTWKSKLDAEKFDKLAFDHNNDLVVISRFSGTVLTYSANMVLKNRVESIFRPSDGEIDRSATLKPVIRENRKEFSPELHTCKEIDLPVWQSPLLNFWRLDEKGNRENAKLKRKNSVQVKYDTSKVSFDDMKKLVEQSLNTMLITDEPEQPRYTTKATTEGFVQLVPQMT